MGKLNYISGCGTDAVSLCPCVSGTTTVDFAAGTACENIYMKRFPSEFGSNTINYHQGVTGSDDFCIDALLENAGDPDTYDNLTAKGKTPCVSACGSYCSGTKYCLCSD